MNSQDIFSRYEHSLLSNYARFPMVLKRGQGSRVWDDQGRDYLDFGSGIAVTSLGHSHPELTEAIARQAAQLIHVSNLYYTTPPLKLAEMIVSQMGQGRCFFCNSGAEANEGLFKLARKHGHDRGRYEILTTWNSFHGRTLAGIAATGQEKVKKGFEPPVDGFRHLPFNDLEAMQQAVTDKTAAILIEGIQGESGVYSANPTYLLGLRKLCDKQGILLMVDAIQCGMFRTGRFQSYQRILEGQGADDFLPDAISMAKGIAGGLPMGAVWMKEVHCRNLGPGSHGTTFGGNLLVAAAAIKVFEIVERDQLAAHARTMGTRLLEGLKKMGSPHVLEVRGKGLMVGLELKPEIAKLTVEGKTPASLFVQQLHGAGLLTIPSGNQTLRLLPALNITAAEVDEAIEKISSELRKL